MAVFPVPIVPLGGGRPGGGLIPRGSRVEVFHDIYWVFIVLGTLVGVVVFAYMLKLAYEYRHDAGETKDVDRPQLGEMPTGGGKGGKLFLSLGLSAVIVISLIGWTYGTLLYVEQDSPVSGTDHITIEVEGFQFGWSYTYPNGHEASSLRLPANTAVELKVTSRDVFHNFGIPELKVKSDAIPGHTTETWLITDGPAEYEAICYELCGAGHSFMRSSVVVMPESEYDEWYANTTNTSSDAGTNAVGDGNANAIAEAAA